MGEKTPEQIVEIEIRKRVDAPFMTDPTGVKLIAGLGVSTPTAVSIVEMMVDAVKSDRAQR